MCIVGIVLLSGLDVDVPKSQLKSLTNLTKYLMNKYDIGTDRVKKHHDYAVYKLCLGNYFPWDKYIFMLSQNKDNIIGLIKENEKIQEKNTRYNKLLSDIKVELDKIERMIQDGTNT
jgi:N-acetyl-anhydromuramyl-L-alanine amidase AmpD